MHKQLEDLRKQWDDGTIVAESMPNEDTLLVVTRLTEKPPTYRGVRYFKLGDEWHVSVDCGKVAPEAIIQWIIRHGKY